MFRILFIADEARANESAVLVHCLAGVSRSVTVTLAYLMHARSLCLEDAFTLVRLRKPDISPNFHFLRQLHSFERQLLDLDPTPLSAQSGDSSYLTPDCVKCPRTGRCDCAFSATTPSSSHSSSPMPLNHSLHHNLRQTIGSAQQQLQLVPQNSRMFPPLAENATESMNMQVCGEWTSSNAHSMLD